MKKNAIIIIAVVLILAIAGVTYDYYSNVKAQQKIVEEKAVQEQQALEQKQAADAALAARTKCVDGDNYSIVTLDHDNSAPGQDILVLAKQDSGAACKYDPTNAVYEIKNSDPEYFKYQVANALVDDVGTGPSGRSVRLYDISGKALITEKKYFGDLTVASTSLTYMGEAKASATSKNCKDFKKITAAGQTPVLTVQKTVDLKTFLVKEGKTTTCIATQ